jgi:NSS family neurotransmitter:Na+ symporter
MAASREKWSSRQGFILATIGSAVGLGNIWRFSYVAGENGGAAFLLAYLFFVIVIGAPIVIAELALGRRGQGDAVSAFSQIAPRSAWIAPGLTGVAASFFVLTFYAVISGWVLKYFVGAGTGLLWRMAGADAGGYFKQFVANPGEPIIWQGAMLAVTMFIVVGGIQRGIERLNRVLMPALATIVLGLAVYSLTQVGSGKGVAFLFTPRWELMLKPEIYLAAMGQAFFSLGVGMGVFITYGSYLPTNFKLPTMAGAIIVGDTMIALLAGLVIFPAVFAFGLDPKAGPELVFITLPQIFLAMPAGKIAGLLFFGLLVAAALTSMVALLEVPVAYLMHSFGMSRWAATGWTGVVGFVLGVPSAMSYGLLEHVKWRNHQILDNVDYIVSNFFLPIGAILIALFVGWRWNRRDAIEQTDLGEGTAGRLWLWSLRILAPPLMAVVLIRSFFS